MIIVTATMWPKGNQLEAYEVLHATITNTTSPGDEHDSYSAHVLARPHRYYGIEGYEADVEVAGHKVQNGFAPLFMSVLRASYAQDDVPVPPSRTLARLTLREVHEFDKLLKGRS